MNVNLANNPFVAQSNNNRSVPVESDNTLVIRQQNDAQRQTVKRVEENQLFQLNPDDQKRSSSQTRPTENSQVVSLTPNRNEAEIESLSTQRESTNSSISQYLQTENIAKREALDVLVGLDIFV